MQSDKPKKKTYTGKKIGISKFKDPWNDFADRKTNIAQTVKALGISRPTFSKWVLEIMEKGVIDENISFIDWTK